MTPIISSTTRPESSSTLRARAPAGSLRSPLQGPCWTGSGGASTFDHSGSRDTVYGAVRLLKWLVDRKITPHIPVWDKSTRSDGTFSRADFVFDRERNVYICPGGKLLHTTGTVIDGGTLRYRASKVDCDVCAFKMRCCPSTPMRYVPRDLHEDARDVARALAKTEAYEQSRRERKKVEMRFAHMKRIFKLDRLRLRGLSGAKDEVLLTATAQNLRRLVKFLCRPPPSAAVTCAT